MAGQDGGCRASSSFPANLRLLLVDDDLASLVVLKKMLEDCHYRVTSCQSGEEALETLRNNKDAFDIIMSDVLMPGIDGLRLLTEITAMKIDLPIMQNDPGQSSANEATTVTKKPRMSWKPEAHNAFLEAIKNLHPEKPLPKKIQEYMETKHGITGLTRQIISSHLQKHRDNAKKLNNGIPGDPRIGSQATSYGVRAPPFPSTLRHQGPMMQAYSQSMYQTEPQQPNHHQMFLGNSFAQTVSAGYDTFLSSQPPWNPSVGPVILGGSCPGVSSVNSTIQPTTENTYSTGMESQQQPLESSSGVYNSNESCRSSVLAQGEFADCELPPMTFERDLGDNWLKELSFEALF